MKKTKKTKEKYHKNTHDNHQNDLRNQLKSGAFKKGKPYH